jgi:Concanavalin A-like lectin/glucanases superfamily
MSLAWRVSVCLAFLLPCIACAHPFTQFSEIELPILDDEGDFVSSWLTWGDRGGGIVVQLNFLEGSGATTFIDSSGQGNNATCPAGQCPTVMSGGEFDNAAFFSAANSDLALINQPNTGTTTSYSYAIWINAFSVTAGGNDANGTFFIDRTTASNGLASLKCVTAQNWFYQIRYDDGSDLTGITGPTITLNQWHYVLMVRDVTHLLFRLFVDGTAQGTVADTGGAITNPIPKFGNHATINQGMTGMIHQFIAYNKALSRDEIWSRYYRERLSFNAIAPRE